MIFLLAIAIMTIKLILYLDKDSLGVRIFDLYRLGTKTEIESNLS